MEKKWFTVKKIYPNIWGFGEFDHNEKVISYLFVGKTKALLFDTGMGIGNISLEIKRITKLPITVVNSHSHFDHIGGNYLFSKVLSFKKRTIIKLSPFSFKVILTPGHTPDSICLYEQSHKLLLAGDTLYPGPIYLHFQESDYKKYLQSIKKLLRIKTIKGILPGHNNFSMKPSLIKTITKKMRNVGDKNYLKIDVSTSLLLKQ
ncbi:MAG: hypothetical protein A3B41_00220 [Candidatus Levybacteria bacterium RIFCSPLOWO2_01_FULL_37_26]|nr:MAG: hypothetical protein A3E40_03765 [Candidatus Levybacteria bacterium RIFCSPHIGHO2_12_FULL_37_9]OGH39544.1 MAG: hypothetical protein A3B41_00220 [Candidatus Levybacteria bacterium RIFCSPLOWO2_01_FULL_37_26]